MTQYKARFGWVALLAFVLAALPLAAQVKDYRDIRYPKLPDFKVAKPKVYTLDNGMTVFLLEDHELPLVTVRAMIHTGSNYMPEDKTGMGSIFGQAMREGGTTTMSGDEMDDFLESRAASVETGMGGDSAWATMNSLKENFDEVFEVFADVLRNPAFSEDRIEVAKSQLKTGIARRNDQVGAIVGREFSRLIYGDDSPLSWLPEYATVAKVERQDLVEWHKQFYHPNNIYLGVNGDFDTATMINKIQERFGSWQKGPGFSEATVVYQKQVPPGVYFIEKSDVNQANIRIGHIGINQKNPDYFAVRVMNEVLGGSFASRLFSTVRSKKGLAYSVFGGVGSSLDRDGIFQVGLSTKSETMGEAVDALREEMLGIINNPPNDEEMQRAKESILNSFVFNYTSSAQILSQQMTYAWYGLPADYLDTFVKNIEAVTKEDVARVAKAYIHPDKTAVLVVGNSADFDRSVNELGAGDAKTIDIAIAPPPAKGPDVVRSAANLEAGRQLVTKAADAIGVEETIRTADVKLSVNLSMGGQAMKLSQEVRYVLPDKQHTTVKTPMGEQVMVVNGDQGMVSMGGRSQPMPGAMVERQQKDLSHDMLVLLSSADSLDAVAAGQETIDGMTCDIVAVTLNGVESQLYVDPEGRIVKQSYQGNHPMQQTPGQIDVRFSNWADMDGHMLPRTQELSFEGEKLATITVESLVINGELDEAMFAVNQ